MNNQTISKLTVLLVALFMLSISATTNAGKKTITLYHTDALGSIVAASDVEGNVIWRKTYDPYGNEVITTENGEEYEGQAYTGKPYDKETGLLYLGQRYYDPEIKRFLSMDPVGFVASNPASFNRYAYANNNPYKFIDPDGRSALTAFGGVLHESYNFTQGRGFNGPMIMGALVDGYNGEGKGFGWSLFEDVTSFVPLGSAVKGYRLIKGRFGNTPTQLAATNLATKSAARLCFVEGTPVHTKDRLKPIEEVEVGDLVASKNDKTGEVEWKPVVELFRNNDREVLNIGFAGPFGKLETLGVTAEHPFWVEGKGWTNAGDLAIDDEISTLENGVVKVASIASDAKKHTTYNFEVEDFHTYFVGESALWVHNMCADDVIDSLRAARPIYVNWGNVLILLKLLSKPWSKLEFLESA